MANKAPNNPVKVGDVFQSKRSGSFEVIDYNGAFDITVRFLETGTIKKTQSAHVRGKNLLDPLAKTVYGVGYMGEGMYKSQTSAKRSKVWTVWNTMMARCYNEKSRSYGSYGAKGVVVSEKWHNFQNFAHWFNKNYVEGSDLEKDILKRHNKVYGPETTRFVPEALNNLLIKPRIKPFGLPRGVNKRSSGRYSACVSDVKKRLHLGTFDSAHLAFLAYKEAKENIIRERSEKYYKGGNLTKDVYETLKNYEIYPY